MKFSDIFKRKTNTDLQKAAPKVPQKAVGIIGLRNESGKINEEFLTALQWPQAAAVYQEMASNDAVIGGCLYLIETLVKKANWHVEPASGEAVDIEAAEFLESCMHDMDGQSWSAFISDALTMLIYGFSFHEIVYKTRRGPLERDKKFRSQYTDGKIGWQGMPIRSQVTLSEWDIDETTGEVIAFKQDPSLVGSPAKEVDIPIDGNLLFKTKAARGNPEGWSLLRRAYRSWYFKKYIEEIEGIGVERSLAGLPVLQPDEDTALFDDTNEDMRRLLDWATEIVSDVRQDRNHGLVLPYGWTLKLLGAEGAVAGMSTDTIIRRHENRIAMSMLADVVMMGGDRTGSFALADTKQGLLVASLQSIINDIAEMLNARAVPTLFAVNNQTLEKLPKIVADSILPVSINEVALLFRALKIDVTKNQKLLNYMLSLVQAPNMDDAAFAEYISTAAIEDAPDDDDQFSDPVDNELKQAEEAYM